MDPLVQALLAPLIALIGGVVAAHLTSKRAAEMQLRTNSLNLYMAARLEAFKDFENALGRWSREQSEEALVEVNRTANIVALVASEETIRTLGALQKILNTRDAPIDLSVLQQTHLLVTMQMHKDLETFSVPDIKIFK